MSKFNVGDVVRLKTGGQRMTVEVIGARPSYPKGRAPSLAASRQLEGSENTVWCVWFTLHDHAGPFRDGFEPGTLEIVDMSKEPTW